MEANHFGAALLTNLLLPSLLAPSASGKPGEPHARISLARIVSASKTNKQTHTHTYTRTHIHARIFTYSCTKLGQSPLRAAVVVPMVATWSLGWVVFFILFEQERCSRPSDLLPRVVDVASIAGFGPMIDKSFPPARSEQSIRVCVLCACVLERESVRVCARVLGACAVVGTNRQRSCLYPVAASLKYENLQEIAFGWSKDPSSLAESMFYAVSKFLIIHWTKVRHERVQGHCHSPGASTVHHRAGSSRAPELKHHIPPWSNRGVAQRIGLHRHRIDSVGTPYFFLITSKCCTCLERHRSSSVWRPPLSGAGRAAQGQARRLQRVPW